MSRDPSPDLPAELKSALDARLHGLSRSDAAERSASHFENLPRWRRLRRDRLGGRRARLCAGADARDLCRGHGQPERAGRDHARTSRPTSLLDVGAGPGTASWAAAEAFSSLTAFTLLDANSALRALALDLGGASTRLRGMTYRLGEARAELARADAADLVVASYMIGEIGEGERTALADLMWAKTRDTLLVVEPGTAGGLCANSGGAGPIDRGGRACRGALPARRPMSA